MGRPRVGARGLRPVDRRHSVSRFSTVAGWVATGGLGIESFKYGHVRESVVSARVTLPSGEALELGPGDEQFRHLFGTEGQFGIITEVVLRVRPKASYSAAHLFYFDDAAAALDFLDRVVREKHRPSHIVFYDRARLAEENPPLRDRLGSGEPIFQEREAVLVHFDDKKSEKEFLEPVESEWIWGHDPNHRRIQSCPRIPVAR